jgi:hypothetical protein
MSAPRVRARFGWAVWLLALGACKEGPTVYLGRGPTLDAERDASTSDAGEPDAHTKPPEEPPREDAGEPPDDDHGDGEDDGENDACEANSACTDAERPWCNLERERCVECLTDQHCPSDLHCKLSEGECDDD